MHKHKWIFYTDLFGSQRWEKLGPDGLTLAESTRDFRTVNEAVADASMAGYVPGDDCAAGALEWRCEAVAPLAECKSGVA